MKNHFDNLPGSDDEDNSKFVNVANKNKQDAGQKKPVQQTKPPAEKKDTRQNVNDNIPVNLRENTQQYKRDREQKPVKEITDHRAHDRQSGTGRVSEPRKGAGGRGGIGNLKDELNQDKILGRVNEQEAQEEQKPPSPQKLTLEEYYAKQGLNINDLDRKRETKDAKNEPIKADWVAKEKLEFVKSKQNNVLEGETKKVAVMKNLAHKIELAPEQDLLGFVSTAPKKQNDEQREPREHREPREPREQRQPKEPREPRQNRNDEKGEGKPRGKDQQQGGNQRRNQETNQSANQGGRKYEEKKQAPHPKLVVTEEDFPSL